MDFDLATAAQARAVILVEGTSDQAALEALAEPRGLGVRLAGLCDADEEDCFRRALQRAGLGSCLSRARMEALGFYVCAGDLEEELIRALGAASVEQVIRAQGEIRSLRILQQQPAQRGHSPEQQLHRFIGTRSGRKSQYARLLVGALDLSRVPRPLDRVLTDV